MSEQTQGRSIREMGFAEGLWVGIILLAMVPVALVARAYVLRQLWEWFVMPAFHLPALSYPVVLGLALLVRTVCDPTPDWDKKEKPVGAWVRVARSVGLVVISNGFALGLGALFHRLAS